MRQEFEKLPEIAEIIKEGVFWDGEIYRRTAICKLTHLYYVRGAWYAWQAKAQAVPECTWSRNEDYYFDTSCGNNFMFTECEDKPSEHQFKHCCYCGGKLIEAQEQNQ